MYRNGHKCMLVKTHALVIVAEGKTLCRFENENGLYVARTRLKAPAPFHRHAR